ncbi:uncharacterized protein LOC129581038 [Paramacrobiotus metropolitanus]|uniref:uncharacterized protein LOC129581038 n=1 Tax=Paramacrobiotus metropolitanus TaxID=2943436 RepID=UPI0024456CC6|nr:uncharacterized protein LOC129581038 [Paramacrobiotus metropolitanus]
MDPLPSTQVDQVTAEMVDLTQKQMLTPAEVQLREVLRADLEMELRYVFQACHLYLYGSSVNTFGCHGCDMDLYLDLHLPLPGERIMRPPVANVLNQLSKRKGMEFFGRILEGRAPLLSPVDLCFVTEDKVTMHLATILNFSGYYDVVPIPHARTPIVKMLHRPSGLSVDISFTGRGLVLRNTGLLRHYSSLDWRVRPLVFTVRRWIADKQLDGPAGLTSYCVTMLVMFFLCDQIPGIFPTPDALLATHRPTAHDPTPAESVQGRKMERRKNSRDIQGATCSELLLRFFQFYSDINFAQCVIEIKSGKILLPEDFRGPNDFKWAYINVQDPFDLSHNIAKSVDFFTFMSFHDEMKRAIQILTSPAPSLTRLLTRVHPVVAAPEVPQARSKFVRDHVEHRDLSWNYYCLSRSKCPDADLIVDYLGNKVKICRNILEDFFKWEIVERDISDNYGSDVSLPDSFEVYAVYDCKATNSSWTARDKSRLINDNRLKGVPEKLQKWVMEMLVGQALHEKSNGQFELEFSIVLINHFVDWHSLYMGVLFKADSPKSRDLAKYIQKNIPKLFGNNLFGAFTVEDMEAARDFFHRLQNGESFYVNPPPAQSKSSESKEENGSAPPDLKSSESEPDIVMQSEIEIIAKGHDTKDVKETLRNEDRSPSSSDSSGQEIASDSTQKTVDVLARLNDRASVGPLENDFKVSTYTCVPLRVRDLPLTYFFRESVPGVFAMLEDYYCCERLNYTAKHMKNAINFHNAGQWYTVKYATWRNRVEIGKSLGRDGGGDAPEGRKWEQEKLIGQLIRESPSAVIQPFRFFVKINDTKSNKVTDDIRLRFIPMDSTPDCLEFMAFIRGRIVGDLRDALEKGYRFVELSQLAGGKPLRSY